MDDKILNWFGDSEFNQGEYAQSKIKDIELINMQKIEDTEEIRELKF